MSVCVIFTCLQPLRCVLATLELRGIDDRRDALTLMLPLLRFAADGSDHTTREAVEVLATEFQLTPAERNELLASGQQAIFNNRVGWANSYLKKAGLLESPRRGALRITARGKQILGDNPARIDVKYLERFPEFI